MTWPTILALVAIGGSAAVMIYYSSSREALLAGFATMNIGAAVLVGSIMSAGRIATALILFLSSLRSCQ